MPAPPRLTARPLFAICLAALGWAFSFGLGAALAPLWLKDAGWDYAAVGQNTGIYYLGIALTAALVPRLMRRWGLRCVAAGCLVSALTVAVFPWGGSLVGYALVRLLNGAAAALTLIPLETYVNRDSPPERRSRNFGFYALAVALGWALGNLVGLAMYRPAPRLAFLLGGAAALLATAVVEGRLARVFVSGEGHAGPAPLRFRRNLFSFGTAWAQGFLEGGMVAFLPLYLLTLGLTEEHAGLLTSGIMIGVILAQVPVAWLADRLGQGPVLAGCYGVVLAGLCLLPGCGPSAGLAACLFVVGACSGSFYPLGLALLGERLPPASLARAGAWYLALNCLGSWVGPDLSGRVMDALGPRAMFAVAVAAVGLVPAVCLALRLAGAARRGKQAAAPPDGEAESRRAA